MHQLLVILQGFGLFSFKVLEDCLLIPLFEQELDIFWHDKPLLLFESPLEDFVYDSVWQVDHLVFFVFDQEVYAICANLDAFVEEVVPNVFGLHLLINLCALGWRHELLAVLMMLLF